MLKRIVVAALLITVLAVAAAHADIFYVVVQTFADGSERYFTVIYESEEDLVAIPCRLESYFESPDWPTSQARTSSYSLPRCRTPHGIFTPEYP